MVVDVDVDVGLGEGRLQIEGRLSARREWSCLNSQARSRSFTLNRPPTTPYHFLASALRLLPAQYAPCFSPTTAMLIRKPSLITSCYGSLQSLSATQSQSSTSSTCWTNTIIGRQCPHRAPRTYATISGDSKNHGHSHVDDWPMPPKGQKWPTPYQIFALKKNEAYSKSRFYHLLKIYHPDRGCTSGSSMSH